MDRRTRQRFDLVLDLAQSLTYLNRRRPFVHSQQREEQRAIEFADAEAAILGDDARVVDLNANHPEGTTYTIAGRRVSGDMLRVVVAFDHDDVERATELRVVTVMYPL